MLFAILVLACAGLLWATIAAAQHIRRARRRRRGGPPQRTPSPAPPRVSPVFERSPTGSANPAVIRSKQLQMHF